MNCRVARTKINKKTNFGHKLFENGIICKKLKRLIKGQIFNENFIKELKQIFEFHKA